MSISGSRKSLGARTLLLAVAVSMSHCTAEVRTPPAAFVSGFCSALTSFSETMQPVFDRTEVRFDAESSPSERRDILLVELKAFHAAATRFHNAVRDLGAPALENGPGIEVVLRERSAAAIRRVDAARTVLNNSAPDPDSLGRAISKAGSLTGDAIGDILSLQQFMRSVPRLSVLYAENETCPGSVRDREQTPGST